MSNKQRAIQYCILNDVILKRKAEIEQLRNGLNDPFGIADYIRKQCLPTSLVFPSPDEVKIDRSAFAAKINVEQKSQNDDEERALKWFLQFINEIPDKDSKYTCYLCTVEAPY